MRSVRVDLQMEMTFIIVHDIHGLSNQLDLMATNRCELKCRIARAFLLKLNFFLSIRDGFGFFFDFLFFFAE